MKRELQFEDFRLAVIKLWDYKVLIFLITLAGLFSGLLYTSNSAYAPTFSATSSVVYSPTNRLNSSISGDLSKIGTIANYSDLVESDNVCEYAASLINDRHITAEEIKNMISLDISSDNSYVMNISAKSTDSVLAVNTANAVAEAFTSEIVNVMGSNSIKVLDVAVKAEIVKNKDKNLKILMFAFGAFIIISGIIATKSLLSDNVRSIAQCVENDDEILGIIPDIK